MPSVSCAAKWSWAGVWRLGLLAAGISLTVGAAFFAVGFWSLKHPIAATVAAMGALGLTAWGSAVVWRRAQDWSSCTQTGAAALAAAIAVAPVGMFFQRLKTEAASSAPRLADIQVLLPAYDAALGRALFSAIAAGLVLGTLTAAAQLLWGRTEAVGPLQVRRSLQNVAALSWGWAIALALMALGRAWARLALAA